MKFYYKYFLFGVFLWGFFSLGVLIFIGVKRYDSFVEDLSGGLIDSASDYVDFYESIGHEAQIVFDAIRQVSGDDGENFNSDSLDFLKDIFSGNEYFFGVYSLFRKSSDAFDYVFFDIEQPDEDLGVRNSTSVRVLLEEQFELLAKKNPNEIDEFEFFSKNNVIYILSPVIEDNSLIGFYAVSLLERKLLKYFKRVKYDSILFDSAGEAISVVSTSLGASLVKKQAGLSAPISPDLFKDFYLNSLLVPVPEGQWGKVQTVRAKLLGVTFLVVYYPVGDSGLNLVSFAPKQDALSVLIYKEKAFLIGMVAVFLGGVGVFLSLFMRIISFFKKERLLLAEFIKDSQLKSLDEINPSLLSSYGRILHLIFRQKRMVKFSQDFSSSIKRLENDFYSFSQKSSNVLSDLKKIAQGTKKSSLYIHSGSNELGRASENLKIQMEHSLKLTLAGKERFADIKSSMNRLEESGATIALRLSHLQEKVGSITSIITVINKIAGYTQLLSLNAAVEAEKAGTQVMGFTVIAQEVQSLADQVSLATADISLAISQMQDFVDLNVKEMHGFAEDVRAATEEVRAFSDSIDGLDVNFSEMLEGVDSLVEKLFLQKKHSAFSLNSMGALYAAIDRMRLSLKRSDQATSSLNLKVQEFNEKFSDLKR